jgi:hypothetical protein
MTTILTIILKVTTERLESIVKGLNPLYNLDYIHLCLCIPSELVIIQNSLLGVDQRELKLMTSRTGLHLLAIGSLPVFLSAADESS